MNPLGSRAQIGGALGRTAGAPFLPTAIPGCFMWFDASRITGLSNGAAVSQWNDLSGNNYHLTQSNNSFRPLYQTNIINGLPSVKFDGTDDHLYRMGIPTPLRLNQPRTIIAITRAAAGNVNAKNDFVINTRNNIENINNSVAGFTFFASTFNGTRYQPLSGSGFTTFVSYTIGTNYIFVLANGLNHATALFRRNFVELVNTTGTAATAFENPAGAWSFAGNSISVSSYYGEVIGYDSVLSLSDIQRVESYLAAKWGVV